MGGGPVVFADVLAASLPRIEREPPAAAGTVYRFG